jgi:Zn-dependent protease with chaperone function
MMSAFGGVAGAMSARTVFVVESILLLPIILTCCFGWAATHFQTGQTKTWSVYRGYGRFILAATVAGWWVTWDLGGRSALPAALVRKSLGTFESSTAATLLFWVPPIVSLGIFLISCYIVDRKLLRQRWSFTQLLWRAWWRLVSFVIPLLMVAVGFRAIFDGGFVGIVWLGSAGIVSRIGTGFLRQAEGMKFNRLKSGELRNRALKMAKQMGVTIGRVYIVPAGKGHLTNAYGLSNAIGLTDSLGKYLTKIQMDYVMAHELAHVKLKHGRKHLLLVVAVFSILTLVSFRFSQHALFLRPLVQVAVIIVPLLAIYYSSRRFEYAADAEAVHFTGEPETAIRALTNLHRIHEVPARCDRFTELFMTHPSLTQRIEAIAKAGQIPAERLKVILDDAGVRELAEQRS